MADQPKIDPERVLERHRPQPWDKRYCQRCYHHSSEPVPWPCDAYQLALALRAARDRLELVEQHALLPHGLVLVGELNLQWEWHGQCHISEFLDEFNHDLARRNGEKEKG